MMLRIAEAPDWDTVNEGKTLTPYWASELLGIELGMLLQAGTIFRCGGYTLEAVKGQK
jgi:hypothetical protein